jgi:hypothetical protein
MVCGARGRKIREKGRSNEEDKPAEVNITPYGVRKKSRTVQQKK